MIKKTSLGVVAGVLFMGVEGLGSLYLIRALFQLDSAQASQFTLVTYMLLALSVVGNAIGFVGSRAVARSGSRHALPWLDRSVRRVVRWLLLAPTSVAAALLLGFVAAQVITPAAAWVWFAFAAGHVLRLVGLTRVFLLVGDGSLGADKWYQLGCVFLFYAAAVPGAIAGLGTPWAGAWYLACMVLAVAIAGRWQRARLPAAEQVHADVEPPEALARQASMMIGYAGAGFLAGNVDALIARSLLGDDPFVQYALAAKLGQVVALCAGLIPAMFGPRITRLHGAGDAAQLRKALASSLWLAVGAAALGCGLLLLLRHPLATWLSPLNQDVFLSVIWFVAPGAVLQAASLAQANAINSMEGPGLIRATAGSALVALVVAAAGGRAWGAPGIALGTVSASVVMLVGIAWFSKRQAPAATR